MQHKVVFADSAPAPDVIPTEALKAIPDLNDTQREKLAEELRALVGPQQVVSKGQRVWKRDGRGNKWKIDLASAIYDCGKLYTDVTGNDWRTIKNRETDQTRDDLIDRQPVCVLARILLQAATGKSHPHSLARAFRRAKERP